MGCNKRVPRIFFNADLSLDRQLIIRDNFIIHHLLYVLRLNVDDRFKIFNSVQGEFLCTILDKNSKYIKVILHQFLREASCSVNTIFSNIHFIIGKIKQDKLLVSIDMLAQLGLQHLYCLSFEYSHNYTLNFNKLHSRVNTSIQQSNRIFVPCVNYLSSIEDLSRFDTIFVADLEGANFTYIANFFQKSLMCNNQVLSKKIALVVGPEAGFSHTEKFFFSKQDNVCFVKLSNNILRAETASIVLASYFNNLFEHCITHEK